MSGEPGGSNDRHEAADSAMSARGATVGRVVASLLLAPWLLLGLWFEVAVGIQIVWANLVGYVSPSQPDVTAAMCFLAANGRRTRACRLHDGSDSAANQSDLACPPH